MMTEPFGNIPKILLKNIQDGFVMRYFIRHVSRRDVLEIDQKQFDVFSRNKLYETFSLKWFITNNAVERNSASVTLYTGTTSVSSISPQMKDGLKRILRVPSQFVIAQAKPVTQSLPLPSITPVVMTGTFVTGSTPPPPTPPTPFDGNNGNWSGWEVVEPNITVTQLAVITE